MQWNRGNAISTLFLSWRRRYDPEAACGLKEPISRRRSLLPGLSFLDFRLIL
jgi:hypothetical protein